MEFIEILWKIDLLTLNFKCYDLFVDIDECAGEDDDARLCHSVLGVCENHPGTYSCKCQDGYFGDGFICEGILSLNTFISNSDKMYLKLRGYC